MDKDEALKLALEALEGNTTNPVIDPDQAAIEDQAITAIKQALAAPVQPVPWSQALESVWAEPDDTPPAAQPAVQEPVAWRWKLGDSGWQLEDTEPSAVQPKAVIEPLYTTPPAAQRQWVGLTDEEIIDVIHPLVMADMPDQATDYEIARAIEAKLKEKNNG